MIKVDLDPSQGILTLRPSGALKAADFEAIARKVDPYIEKKGELKGILLEAARFPGWDSFPAMLKHFKFVKNHHRKVRRIAVVSDSRFLTVAPKFANHFVAAELRPFGVDDRSAALAWLTNNP